jgi:hypothetical protein
VVVAAIRHDKAAVRKADAGIPVAEAGGGFRPFAGRPLEYQDLAAFR